MVELDRFAVSRCLEVQETIQQHVENYNFLAVVQAVHHFCAIDLGGFYLDIIKDRQYTAKGGSHAQRSCQSALYLILQALVRWIAPILSFTADEIWQSMPGETEENVFLTEWFNGLVKLNDDNNASISPADWERIIAVKTEVNKALETARKAGELGGSLEAEVQLVVSEALHGSLVKLKDELRFVLITSQAKLFAAGSEQAQGLTLQETAVDGLSLVIQVSTAPKCERCWHRRDDVGVDSAHPSICGRCVENVVGEGEQRQFA